MTKCVAIFRRNEEESFYSNNMMRFSKHGEKKVYFSKTSCEKKSIFLKRHVKKTYFSETSFEKNLLFENVSEKNILFENVMWKKTYFSETSFEKKPTIRKRNVKKNLLFENVMWKKSTFRKRHVKKNILFETVSWIFFARLYVITRKLTCLHNVFTQQELLYLWEKKYL